MYNIRISKLKLIYEMIRSVEISEEARAQITSKFLFLYHKYTIK